MNQLSQSNYDYILDKHIGLVYSIVNRFNVSPFDRDDLIQAGLLGLIKAADNFNVTLGYQFSTYAVPYILGYIKKELRQIKPDKDRIDVKEYIRNQAYHLCEDANQIFKNKYFYNDEMIVEMANLDNIEKEIIKLKFIEILTEQEIAIKLNVSQSTISRKLKKIKEKIKKGDS